MPFLYKVMQWLDHWLQQQHVIQHFHKLHHTYKQPTAFSVTAIHPVEFLNIQAIYIAPMFLMKIYARKFCNLSHFNVDILTALSCVLLYAPLYLLSRDH